MKANRKTGIGTFRRVEDAFDECFDRIDEMFPDFGSCELHEDEAAGDDNGAGSERQYAYCMDGDPMVIAFAPKARHLGTANLRGLMRHEFGHALEYRYGVAELERRLGKLPETVERRADVIAEHVWGEPIVYDQRLVQCVGRHGTHPRPRHLPDKKEKLKPNGGPTGDCYRQSALAAQKLESSGAKLVHGRVEGSSPVQRHAWVEIDNKIIDPTATYKGVRGGMPPTMKSALAKLGLKYIEEASYTNEQALKLMLRHGHWGPWHGDMGTNPNGKPQTITAKLSPNDNRAQLIEAGRTWCEEWQEENSDYDGEPTHHETDASLATLATREARKRFGSDDDAVRAFLAGVSLAWTGEVTEPFVFPPKLRPNGESLLVGYHGTTRRMGKPETISESRSFDWGPGLYFSTDPSDSIRYGSHLYRAEVSLTNPVVVGTANESADVLSWMKRALRIREEDLAEYNNKFAGAFELYRLLVEMGEYKPSALSDALRKKGYDGILVKRDAIRQHQPEMDADGDYLIVWSPEQIVSWQEVPLDEAREAYRRRSRR